MLTVTVRMKENALNADVHLTCILTKHEVLTDTNFPRLRVVRQKVRPHRPATSFPTSYVVLLSTDILCLRASGLGGL